METPGAIALPDVIQNMLEPEFYPHPVSVPIDLIQTHISYVLLTGNYAYKVKKSVDFGFLNFSTLAKRKRYCEAEVRLNRRLAASLYLGVVTITKMGDRLTLDGTGEVVEYAVKMVQFPQNTLLSHRFETGELTDIHIEQLAQIVAKFHATAATDDYIRSFGEIARIGEAIDDNYAGTRHYIGGPQTQRQFDETHAYTDRFLVEHSEWFQSRQQHQRIRECHGDLHLKNICLWQEKIVIFDCIEFNEAFRFVDVMYDVAFTVMDLDARGRWDLGNRFLNVYLEQTGDWEGLLVLPLYLCRQAYVRAKVNSLLLDEADVSPQDKAHAYTEAAQYYRLAWRYTQPHTGQLILMSGLSGSGKSTVARAVSHRLGGIQIRSDAVRKHLAGVPLHEKGNAALYSVDMNHKTYDRLLTLGLLLAQQGYPVILDAKYDRQVLRERAIAQAKSHQIHLQILHCTAPLPVLRDRLEHRQGDVSDATAHLLTTQQATAEPFNDFERPYVKIIDTTQDIEPQLEEIK